MESLGLDFEIIFVDDCGPSESLSILLQLASEFDRIVIVEMLRNVGQVVATAHGISVAKGTLVVTLDDDLQHAPEDIPVLFKALQDKDLDLVVARFLSRQHSFMRNLASEGARRLAVKSLPVPRDTQFSSFRIMRREVFERFFGAASVSTASPGWMYLTAPKHAEVELNHYDRAEGRSSYSVKTLFSVVRPLFRGFADRGLKVLMLLSVFQILVAIGGGAYLLLFYAKGDIEAPGYTSIVLLLLALLGFLGVGLGLVAQYLRSIRQLILSKPESLVRTIHRS